MTSGNQSIADLFDLFFSELCVGQKPAAVGRTLAVREHLEAYLESHGPGVLTTGDLALLRSEQQFRADGAFVRTMHADDLLYALAGYLDPDHRLPEANAARSQVVIVGKLAQWLWNRGLLDYDDLSCAIHELEGALSEARRALVAARGTRRR